MVTSVLPEVLLDKQTPEIKPVDSIPVAKRKNPEADVTVLERDINRLVRKLHGWMIQESAVDEAQPA